MVSYAIMIHVFADHSEILVCLYMAFMRVCIGISLVSTAKTSFDFSLKVACKKADYLERIKISISPLCHAMTRQASDNLVRDR
jgi:hypothetical protein